MPVTSFSDKIPDTLTALLPGFIIFFLICGPDLLDVTSLEWLPPNGDPYQAWLGWSFFQHSPWTWPLGLNPNLGLELNNSIIFTDSNPLLAFLFKTFSPWLPYFFQYLGLWLLACLMLQSFFGYKLASIYARDKLQCLLAAFIFAMSMPMIFRMGCHFNLVAHFIVLAALYLCLVQKSYPGPRKSVYWAILLAAAALIHSYIFVMASILWIADLGDRRVSGAVSWPYAFTEAVIIVAFCGFACWQAGYFIIGSASSDGGFGLYRMNLWSIIDSDGFSSYLMPDLPSVPGEDEGFAYLGMGGILLVICAIITLIIKKTGVNALLARPWPFYAGLLILFLLALSNNMGIFVWQIHIPIPKRIEDMAQFFRSSGRMFWPVFYTIIVASFAIIFHFWSRQATILLLLAAITLQAPDVHALVSSQFVRGQNDALIGSLTFIKDGFWQMAAKKYSKVRGYPIRGPKSQRWNVFGFYALKNGMGTDIVYLSRYNTDNVATLEKDTLEKIKTGKLDGDSLYIVDDATFELAKKSGANARMKVIDGFNVIAPEWDTVLR